MIIHFSPLELYPPVQNLLWELKKTDGRVIVLTTRNSHQSCFDVNSDRIVINRIGQNTNGKNFVERLFWYTYFYIIAILQLILFKPDKVFYFETISSFPAYCYKKFFRSAVGIYIHYHEYTSPREYETGMWLVRTFHRFEHWIYPKAFWVSHTNAERLELFVADISPTMVANKFVLPNYPPCNWRNGSRSDQKFPVKFIYVGSLSLQTMYTKEFAEWVLSQNGRVHWDIYSHNCKSDASEYLIGLKSEFITTHQEINYSELPAIIRQYDVGVILYNGHIPNYVFNAPNKLFEYLACGLDVWFPEIMLGCMPYQTHSTFPKVVPVDFTNTPEMNLEKLINRKDLSYYLPEYYCEEALSEIVKQII